MSYRLDLGIKANLSERTRVSLRLGAEASKSIRTGNIGAMLEMTF